MNEDSISTNETCVPPPLTLLLEDRFERPVRPGAVIGSRSDDGTLRLGSDREGTLSIDHGQLRMGWLAHAGWGRSTLAYGPYDDLEGVVLVVRALNGLTTSQTDPRPEGGRAMVRRIVATFPRPTLRRPRIRESLMIGWFTESVPKRSPIPVAAVFHRAGEDATGELWFAVGKRRVRVARNLQNLPATYMIGIRDGVASLYAWSYANAHGYAAPGEARPIAQLELNGPPPESAFAAVHQAVLGEVQYRVDTRIDEIRILRSDDRLQTVAQQFAGQPWWQPVSGRLEISEEFGGAKDEISDLPTTHGDARWQRVLGDGVIERTGTGRGRVRGTLAAPNPGRTVYVVPWNDPVGVEVSALIIPPGSGRGEGHQGRSGLVIWQDPDNHLVVNHFIDDGSVGVSISAFLRTGGMETMFEWDAVWSNVASRVAWGEPFKLSVVCDGHQFLCRIADEPVLYRAFSDYRSAACPLEIRGVGLVANWEWGDDTGTEFADFVVRSITPSEARTDAPDLEEREAPLSQ